MKKVVIGLIILFAAIISLCFIPFNANKFIPIVEKQVQDKYGINAHLDKLILKIGPSIILKSPSINLSYNNLQLLMYLFYFGDNFFYNNL